MPTATEVVAVPSEDVLGGLAVAGLGVVAIGIGAAFASTARQRDLLAMAGDILTGVGLSLLAIGLFVTGGGA